MDELQEQKTMLEVLIEFANAREELNEQQKELLVKIYKCKRGQILRKGKTERILYGADHMFIAYMTKRSKRKVTALNIPEFLKWAEKAEFVEE
ncbi:hypothetical protein QI30_08990 [Kurthia sp. 3B1D]|uniref:Uncharacterized protein n=2 Tax=Kurthia TaxID=1649 RepID=A0A433RSF6_9BACL|nr:hypothetical protein [Kurthia sp. 3B1D]RUS55089.1 hypothetical protein QI30_08990 [Kurthia sp. 3B1D]